MNKELDDNVKHRYGPYTCPRCNYQTHKKCNIISHFNRKISCPPTSIDTKIDLTDEVKKTVLTDRQFFIVKKEKEEQKQVTNNIVNNIVTYNQYNAIVKSMEYSLKADKYSEHMKKKGKPMNVLCFKEQIDKALYDAGLDGEYLENLTSNSSTTGYDLTEHTCEDHTRTIGEITKVNNHKSLTGIVYDGNKMLLNDEDVGWEQHYEKEGIKTLINYVKEQYWDKYEAYLINRMKHHKNLLTRQKAKELLKEYYIFLRAFGIRPENLDEQAFLIWADAVKEKVSVTKNIYKEALEMVKINSSSNIKALNFEIMKLMKDPDFREYILCNDNEDF